MKAHSHARLAAAAVLVALVACKTPNNPDTPEPPAETKAEPKAAPAAPPKSVAATPFYGKDGAPEWLGFVIADHITRRLLVQPAEGANTPPLYVFGYRQAMSAARSIGISNDKMDARADDVVRELGADGLVVGSYSVTGKTATIEWRIAGAAGEKQTLELSLFDASKGAYSIGEQVLEKMAKGDETEAPLALAADAAEAWGTALASLAVQSRDPRASVVLRKSDRQAIMASLDKVTKVESTFAPAWATRAAVASMGSETEEQVAMNATKAALNASSADPSSAISLYYSQQHLAEQSEARQTLVEALSTYPGSLEVMNYLAQAYYLAGEYDECLKAWEAYVERVPKSLHGQRRRLHVMANLGKKEEAVAAAKKLADEHPESLPTQAALASRQIDAGQMELAQATLTEQLRKYPDHPLLLTRLSYIELESGSADRALTLARKAVEVLGDGRGERLAGYAHIDLARALALTGKRGEARESLKKSLRLGVSGEDVFRLATDPRLQGFIELPIVLNPED